MGGYRTLKRALGETNIERKCRVLFGVCLALLILAAFYGVWLICQGLVNEVTHQAGEDAVDMELIDIHWNVWETNPQYRVLLDSFRPRLRRNRVLKTAVLRPAKEQSSWLHVDKNSIPPSSEYEAQIMQELRDELKTLLARETDKKSIPAGPKESPSGAPLVDSLPTTSETMRVPFRPVPVPEHGYYYYYQPVVWENVCQSCHGSPLAGSVPGSDMAALNSEPPPFRVIKVQMGDKETRDALNGVLATLISAWVLTVFVAMLGLYMIVKYVIVKPLTHLRDISEAISQGNTEQRADIHTNDEFEELGDAFNRMMRRLTDAQEQLRSTNSRLDLKVDELAHANMQLYEMNRLKSDFLANMSHELRTPLNSIIGFSDVLQGIESLTEKQRRYAQNIQKSGRVLLDMINDILDLAKLEAGKMELRLTEFRIDAVVSAQCDMMRSLTEDKNIELEVLVDPDSPPVYQDQGKIQQILTNLLSNAIKFTPEGGRISVRAEGNEEEKLRLTVADTGVGIPEEDREIIFEKFRQSTSVLGRDTLTREYSGTGLGLSIVKEICKLLGGEISFTSELGKGSTFQVVLPWSLPNRPRAAA